MMHEINTRYLHAQESLLFSAVHNELATQHWCTQHWWTYRVVSKDGFFSFSSQGILKRNGMRMEIWEFPGHVLSAFLHLTSLSKTYLCRFWRLSVIPWLGIIISGNPTTQCNALLVSSSLCLIVYQASWRNIMEMSFLDSLFIYAIPPYTIPREMLKSEKENSLIPNLYININDHFKSGSTYHWK